MLETSKQRRITSIIERLGASTLASDIGMFGQICFCFSLRSVLSIQNVWKHRISRLICRLHDGKGLPACLNDLCQKKYTFRVDVICSALNRKYILLFIRVDWVYRLDRNFSQFKNPKSTHFKFIDIIECSEWRSFQLRTCMRSVIKEISEKSHSVVLCHFGNNEFNDFQWLLHHLQTTDSFCNDFCFPYVLREPQSAGRSVLPTFGYVIYD